MTIHEQDKQGYNALTAALFFIVTIVIRYCTFLYCKLAYTKQLSCKLM